MHSLKIRFDGIDEGEDLKQEREQDNAGAMLKAAERALVFDVERRITDIEDFDKSKGYGRIFVGENEFSTMMEHKADELNAAWNMLNCIQDAMDEAEMVLLPISDYAKAKYRAYLEYIPEDADTGEI
jgi:hypothetical protein